MKISDGFNKGSELLGEAQKREIRNYYQSVIASDFLLFSQKNFSVICHDVLHYFVSCKIAAEYHFCNRDANQQKPRNIFIMKYFTYAERDRIDSADFT